MQLTGIILICSLIVITRLAASAEGSVGVIVSKVHLTAGDSGYNFVMEVDNDGKLFNISSTWNGNTYTYNGETFGNINDAYLRGVKVVAPNDTSLGSQSVVIVVLPYEPDIHGRELNAKESVNVVRLRFNEGKLVKWEKSIRHPENLGTWIFSSWDETDGFKQDGEQILKDNPERNPYAEFVFGEETP